MYITNAMCQMRIRLRDSPGYDMLVLREPKSSSQARINPVPHLPERLPLPVSNESHWRHSPATKFTLCINSTSQVRAYVCASASTLVFPFAFRSRRPREYRCTLVGETRSQAEVAATVRFLAGRLRG